LYTFSDLIARLRAICWCFSGNEKLGHNYDEYEGMGQVAVNHLLETKSGQVRGAFSRYDTGPIDVVWGEVRDPTKHTGYGIARILDKHGQSAVDMIGRVIKNGSLKAAPNNKLKIICGKRVLILSKTFGDEERHIVLSCYINDGAK
jgi:hypothetical protein